MNGLSALQLAVALNKKVSLLRGTIKSDVCDVSIYIESFGGERKLPWRRAITFLAATRHSLYRTVFVHTFTK